MIERLLEIAWLDLIDPRTPEGAVVWGVLILLAAVICARLVGAAARRALKGDGLEIGASTRGFVVQTLQASIFVFGLVIYAHMVPALHKLANALLASASIFSLVVGIAAQATLGNLIAGLAMIMYRPFAVGDRIQFNPPGRDLQTVRVASCSLGHTWLATDDGQTIVVPNTTMFTSVVTLLRPGVAPKPTARGKPRR